MNLTEPRVITMLARSCLIMLLIAACPLKAEPTFRWGSDQISVGRGKVIGNKNGLEVQADAEGKIFVSVATAGVTLEDFPRVGIEFFEAPANAQFFVAWRTSSGNEGMHQFWLPAGQAGTVSIPMSEEARWAGAADLLGMGIILEPYGRVRIESISLLQPTLAGEMIERQRERLRDWSSFTPWKPADINLYTGTATVGQGLTPVQFFARLLLVVLAAYLIYALATARLRKFNWNIAGALVLACWIGLDLLWQFRLGHQVRETYITFAGKTPADKLMASGDAPIVQFIARVKDAIHGEAPRIFLASANDYAAMLSAYYIAPLNTHWHRKGPELPDRKFLAQGDYILLVPPYATQYQPADNTISLPDASKVPVEPVLQERMGVLLRVI